MVPTGDGDGESQSSSFRRSCVSLQTHDRFFCATGWHWSEGTVPTGEARVFAVIAACTRK